MALIWSLIWIILIKESPESDKWISHSELHYIQQSLKDAKPVESFPVPWKNILICKAVWALQVAIFCEAWGFYTLLTLLPKYYKGGLALTWFLLWVVLIQESPESDKWISNSELQYIQQSLKDSKPTESFSVPWINILTCKAVWALQVAVFCESWGFYTLLTLLPKYFKGDF
ncbi:sialin-like [Sitophilus oryzae]|uniref:Sialin-like n=1 Tax=Sitophilus oryzae TaxID=7048 RepID=A0A6J2Y3D8_SITOR|nr:sialin-like [Sitophilus oryzae]